MTDAPVRVACVGASLTFGLGLPNRREQCYPAVMARLLEQFHRGGYNVRNFGYAGAAAMRASHEPYWKTVSYASATRFAPQLTLLCLGTNDAQVVNADKLGEFEADLAALAEHFAGLTDGGAVLLATPPPVFEPLPQIDIAALDQAVRPGVRRVAERLGVGLLDFYGPLRDRPELFPDNLHPDAEGAASLGRVAYEGVREWESRRRA
ncbi:GDSL-type esterase/lipase family protein [Pirellulimonas nuda]|uniref:GDSL-type esterase/lipase family protein n=1 Tax=Pirellulimonas nuda TaxID=2528009 RepID=UPI0018D2BA58|nr:GDSL-type esterase/lipase family protein [Pirellulimonas nuda]